MSKSNITPAANRTRVLYEITGPQGTHEVVVTSTKEFKAMLAFRLPKLPPYSVNAVACLIQKRGDVVQIDDWRVRCLGVLALQIDQSEQAAPQKRRSKGRGAQSASERLPPQAEAVASPVEEDTEPNTLF